jgi:hypothetical protein
MIVQCRTRDNPNAGSSVAQLCALKNLVFALSQQGCAALQPAAWAVWPLSKQYLVLLVHIAGLCSTASCSTGCMPARAL